MSSAKTYPLDHYLSNQQLDQLLLKVSGDVYFQADQSSLRRYSTMAFGLNLVPLNSLSELQLQAPVTDLPESLKSAPFLSGVLGLVDFEYSHQLEPGEFDSNSEATLVLVRPEVVLVSDHQQQESYLISQVADVKDLSGLMNRYIGPENQFLSFQIYGQPSTAEARYKEMVLDVKRKIREGDLFQCVVAEKRQVRFTGNARRLFLEIKQSSEDAYCFYYQIGSKQTFGASPERLVSVSTDGHISSFPIAGTRPRGSCPKTDERQRVNLRRSPKERSEHLMLVDLARNDLGKVTRPGQVRVPSFMQLKSYRNVHHLVSEVTGLLADGCRPVDVFHSCFPAGTLSGAPKIEALKTIRHLEAGPRGFYGGCMVLFDDRGCLESFIVIRSAQVVNERLTYGVGAGVVAGSTPDGEYQEIGHKARGIEQVLMKEVSL